MIVLHANFFLTLLATKWCQYSRHILGKSPLLLKKLCVCLMTIWWLIFSGKSHTLPGCLPLIYQKNPAILVGNFHWVRTVPVVHHLLKVSGLSRHASRLDSSYKMNFQFGTSEPGKQRDYLFRISVCPGNFPVGRTKKRLPCIYIPRGISGNLW